jgi:hypothetical protein
MTACRNSRSRKAGAMRLALGPARAFVWRSGFAPLHTEANGAFSPGRTVQPGLKCP